MMAEQMLIKGIFITAQIYGGQGRYHRGHAYVGKSMDSLRQISSMVSR